MNTWLAYVLTSFLLLAAPFAHPLTLQQKFEFAQAGDFIVTAQEENLSLLSIHSLTKETLLLEEISIPEQQVDLKKWNWKKWVKEKAPGHTSWVLYEIDLKTGKLIECFSYSKNGWLYLDSSEQFLTQLLTLPLVSLPDANRKKIGPPPAQGEPDWRSFWNPPFILEGKKHSRPTFDVWTTQWPDDGSRLALCTIELYFSKQHPRFPFPYWLEVKSPHYTFKMRTVDSGQALFSPLPEKIPHRPPQFLSMTHKGKEVWKILVQTPLYFSKLNLFAIDLTKESKASIPIPFQAIPNEKETILLTIAVSDLNQILQPGHRYQWILIPENSRDIYVESEEIFQLSTNSPHLDPNATP